MRFATFPPLATILIVGFGIAVAQASGLFTTLLRRMVARVPGKYLTFALSMTAMVAHVAGDAAYVTLILIGALVFRAAGYPDTVPAQTALVAGLLGRLTEPLRG